MPRPPPRWPPATRRACARPWRPASARTRAAPTWATGPPSGTGAPGTATPPPRRRRKPSRPISPPSRKAGRRPARSRCAGPRSGPPTAPQRQARALDLAALAAIRATACQRRTGRQSERTESKEKARARGRADIALFSVLFYAGLRRTEAAALAWGDVEASADGSGLLWVRRSKTDPEAEGSVRYLPRDAVRALEAVCPEGASAEDPVCGLSGEAVRKVQNEAVPAMQAAFEKLRGFFHGCDYEQALDAKPQAVLVVYLRAIDHVFGQNDGWKRLRTLVKELSAAFALAVPRPETEAITPHLAFWQRVMAMIRKRLADDAGGGAGHGRQRDIDAAVRQVIAGAIDADEVIDLFAVAGLSEARLDILSDEFLGRVAALEQKNLALETLRKLLNDQIRITERTNIVQSRKFLKALEDAMLRYTNKAITTAEMISQLIDLAKSLRDAQRHGEELGLSREETAFYDALAENSSAREAMLSDTLRLMARELTEIVKNMPKLDWTQRESVRANLRRNVRRLLAKHGYPPDLAEDATQLVLRQAELSTENSE